MTKSEMIELLKTDVGNWNKWILEKRKADEDFIPDLSEADLMYADLSNANLMYADLSNANLREANLRKADLRNANLMYADLRNADLSNVNLMYANLMYANLMYANLMYANLSNANLRETNLRNADLMYANLSNANLRNADLRNANLREANLRNADLMYANLREANLRNADLMYANLSNANLREANLMYADLRNADLSGSKGLISNSDWMDKHFESTLEGWVVYKKIGNTDYNIAEHWVIEEGSELIEVVNANRTNDCGCGANFGSKSWVQHYCASVDGNDVWVCLIEWKYACDIVVPYNSDGKARCGRLRLLRKI